MKSTAEGDSAVQMLLDCLPEVIRFRVIRYLDFLMITAPAAAREATTARAMIPLSEVGSVVPPETVVDAVVKENIRLVGLSALMTTTLPSMEETVRQLHALPNPPSIMVGGAVVTPEYAQKMGAFYAKDARASVEIAKKILG